MPTEDRNPAAILIVILTAVAAVVWAFTVLFGMSWLKALAAVIVLLFFAGIAMLFLGAF
ncbi:MAG: hypothetical protein R3200_04215 [Xanthomonadales bacterium]|nr:hypothetical protein [Xanthomonadales bacterium]